MAPHFASEALNTTKNSKQKLSSISPCFLLETNRISASFPADPGRGHIEAPKREHLAL